MKVISVNVGTPRPIEWEGRIAMTGIYKEAVQGTVAVRKWNLDGDAQADLTVHGGPNKAVYVYPSEHYSWWQDELKTSLPWGIFGENLTTEGLDEKATHVGDTLRIGSALFMVTSPRLPCFKLAGKFRNNDMIRIFLESGRSGFYLTILEEGELQSGAAIRFTARDENRLTVREALGIYAGDVRRDVLERAVHAEALPESWRNRAAEALQNMRLP